MMDMEVLLQPASDDAPSGDALDYDVGFLQLEIASRGRSEQQMGDSVSAGEKPDWRTVETLALELCSRGKDLRVAALLARARLQNDGFAGLEESLRLLAGYVSRYWDTVHPVPEPNDDDTIRVNALAALSDPAGLLGEVRRASLVSATISARFRCATWISPVAVWLPARTRPRSRLSTSNPCSLRLRRSNSRRPRRHCSAA